MKIKDVDVVDEVHAKVNEIFAAGPKNAPIGSIQSYGRRIVRKQYDGSWAEIRSSRDTYEADLQSKEKGDILSPMTTSKNNKKVASLIPMAESYLDNGFNVLLIGPHGTGKTESLLDLARSKGIKMKYFSCSTLDPFTDLVGVPTPRVYCEEHGKFENRSEHMRFNPECSLMLTENLKMVRPHDVDEAELIFFDEFNRADSKTMNAVFEIIQFQSINGDPLPNLKACWAAMNPPDENYQVEDTDPALLDRFDLYIEVDPRPSVPYMSQYMPEQIAKALMTWWEQHQRAIKMDEKTGSGKYDSRRDYISPRRLMKMGLVWCATKDVRSVWNTIPKGQKHERQKLADLLKMAQKHIDGGTEPEEEDTLGGNGIGDRPAEEFDYTHANIQLCSDDVAEYLEKNPMALETHQAVVDALKEGVGGGPMVENIGKVLNALNKGLLEGMINNFPYAKQSHMRLAFIKLYQANPDEAKKLKNLHSVLGVKANNPDWPKSL